MINTKVLNIKSKQKLFYCYHDSLQSLINLNKLITDKQYYTHLIYMIFIVRNKRNRSLNKLSIVEKKIFYDTKKIN